MRSGPGIGPIRMEKEVAVDDLGERSQEALPADPEPEPAGHSRREFLKRAAGVAVGLPAAGALAGTAAAAPRISVASRAKPFDGVTLQFAKAPFGTDEKDVIAKLLKPFEDKTGVKIEHTIVPWNVEGATYATNYAGPNPFDVSYQTSTDLTGLGTKGVLEVLNTSKWLERARATRRPRRSSSPTRSRRAPTRGSSTACRASSAARSSTTTRTCSRRPASPTSRGPSPSSGRGGEGAKLGGGVWGHNVPLSNKDFTWYFLYHGLHNRGVDIISKDQSKVTFNTPQAAAALQFYVDLITNKVQPPVGQYDREAGVVAVQGRPDRLPPRRAAAPHGLPRGEAPVQVGLHQPGGRRRQADDLLDDRPLGHGLEGREQGRRLGAREVPLLAGVRERVRPALRLGAGPQRRQHGQDPKTGKIDAQVQRVNGYVLKGWDGLPTGPKMAQLTDVYGQAIEAAATGKMSVKAALAKAQKDGTAVLKS